MNGGQRRSIAYVCFNQGVTEYKKLFILKNVIGLSCYL